MALMMERGDVGGLALALEASEGEVDAIAAAKARDECARLRSIEGRFEMPAIESTVTHSELVDKELVAHVASRDGNGRLCIKTEASFNPFFRTY